MELETALRKIAERQHLSREEAAAVMGTIMSGGASDAQVGALLTGLHMKGETVEEITGFAETMRSLATPIKTTRTPLVDTCGTGGDHSGTFNISTAAAFVVAGAGVAVAKHGNRSATSKSGSADVLEALGVNIEATPEQVGRCIDEAGIGFLFARQFHTAMKHVANARAVLGIRTVFNVLGPLTNPAGADRQVVGVFDSALLEPLAKVLLALGAHHAFTVAGSDGLDEITTTGPSMVAEACYGVKRYEVTPEQVGLSRASAADLAGGEAAENADILRRILEGHPGPHRDIVLLNAAPALVAGGVASNLAEGVEMGAEAIDNGAAGEKLELLIRVSQG